ncbi:hypothetical protein AB0D10_01040 [Kitasatospora sp. NPDC048545]|uniref:hypothetical protein n=1 Tax=Kitasatospora sp. NPDC048545 TaxID=3157208 RepID=UPI0033CD265A
MAEDEAPASASGDDLEDILPPWEGDLLAEFQGLAGTVNPQRRGLQLEKLLERAFQRAHFRVVRNPAAAKPRQTDLMASSRDARYLIESKWESKPIDVATLGGLRERMERAGGPAIGVLISVSGVAKGFDVEVVSRKDKGLVVVFDETDIRQALADPNDLVRLLSLKYEQLVVHSNLHLGGLAAAKRTKQRRRPVGELPVTRMKLVGLDGEPLSAIPGAGFFTPMTFSLELPDIDWVPAGGVGVALDMPVPASDEAGVVKLLHELHAMGWTTGRSQWVIQQWGQSWHGVGAEEFVSALGDWKQREAAVEKPHHSESFVYFDVCDGGFYSITADLSCSPGRRAFPCNVSFQLSGVPLDASPLQHLYELFDVSRNGYFRPLPGKSVDRTMCVPRRVPLDVVGFVHQPGRRDDDEWVVGVVAKNPFAPIGALPEPSGWPFNSEESGLLVCSLRSHHQPKDAKDSYFLWSWEHARTTDASVVRVVADW